MLLGDYIFKNKKTTSAQELALMARQLMEVVMDLDRKLPGCTVERAEFIITERTVGWKVEMVVPGEEQLTTEEKKRKLHEEIEKMLK